MIEEFKHYFLTRGLKCHWNFWLLPKSFRAITLFGHIFFNMNKEDLLAYLQTSRANQTMRHERIHVLQAESFKTKYFAFYVLYLYYWIKNLFVYGCKNHIAYRNIPFEREAFQNQHLQDYQTSHWKDYCD
jgi:hypothetical protein